MTKEEIKKRLQEFDPSALIEVIDLTGTADHWEVLVESSSFQGLNRMEQHKKVMSCFGPELKTGEVHALSIKTKIKS